MTTCFSPALSIPGSLYRHYCRYLRFIGLLYEIILDYSTGKKACQQKNEKNLVLTKIQKKALTKRFVRCYHPTRKGKGVFENTISETLFPLLQSNSLKKARASFMWITGKASLPFLIRKECHYEKKKCFKILWLYGL